MTPRALKEPSSLHSSTGGRKAAESVQSFVGNGIIFLNRKIILKNFGADGTIRILLRRICDNHHFQPTDSFSF